VQVLKSSLIDIISQESWVDFVHPDFRLIFRDESHLSLKPATELSKSMGEWPLEPTPGTEPLFPKTWHLDAIQAPTFWTHTKGMPQVTIAVIDLGFEADHPDLKSAWRAHPGEIPENGLDDDGNGYVDDVRGWNFATGNQNLIYGAGPGHGTATSGIVGARENSIGTLGVCPRCSMLPLVIDDRVSTAILAFQYAKAQGASVVSNSWGYSLDLPVMQGLVVAIDELTKEGRGGKGASVVFAMGNSRRDDCGGRSPDLSSLEQVIAVSSVGHNLKIVNSSGYGPCLDLVAPSSATPQGGIVTTDRVGVKGFNSGQKEELTDLNYTQRFYGTSAAAPQVSGALGLIYSRWDGISRQVAESMLMQKTQKVHQDTAAYDPRSGKSKEYGYGLLFLGF
jgi:subtilisin family serine protease